MFGLTASDLAIVYMRYAATSFTFYFEQLTQSLHITSQLQLQEPIRSDVTYEWSGDWSAAMFYQWQTEPFITWKNCLHKYGVQYSTKQF